MIETQHVPKRDEIPVEYTWDLTTIYSSDAAWEEAVSRLDADLPAVTALEGGIGASPESLLHAIQLRDDIQMRLWQIYVYAARRSDSDIGDSVGQMLSERAGSLVARASAASAFVDPEILEIPEEQIATWIKETPGLQVYEYALQQLANQRPHIRSAEVEGILAQFIDITRAPNEIYEMLTSADLSFGSIEDEHGQTVQLSHARYGRLLESQDPRVRRDTFKVYYSSYQGIRNTLGTTLAAEIRSHVLNARLRGYDSALEAALKPNDIPTDVYRNLISTVNDNLPRLHRYVSLRKKLLGLDEQHFYDMYVSLVPKADVDVPYAEGIELVSKAFKPLGAEYGAAIAKTFSSRWIDVYENQGKRSGAYSNGSFTTAPFILLNYENKLRDTFTLAHELGHSMHSYFTRRTQPFVYGDYTIFVAEVASTLNEALLTDHLLKTSDDRDLRRSLVAQQLDDIRMTLFRQTMFAEFEHYIHELAEANEPLTADNLTKPYADLIARYYGPDLVIDDELTIEWTRIPHLYYNFYVYQYATGLAASLALSKQILSEGQPAVDRYLKFLSSGSSKSSIDLLRGAGVDMASPAPIQAAMDTFDRLLDELEALS